VKSSCPGSSRTHHSAPGFEDYAAQVMLNEKQHTLVLRDYQLGEDSDRRRVIGYESFDVFLLQFSIVSPPSFQNIQAKWWPEVQHYAPTTPFLLVGLKTDLRADPEMLEKLAVQGEKPVSFEEASALGQEIGAYKYVECSSLRQEGVKTVFEEALRAILTLPKKSGRNASAKRHRLGGCLVM